MALSSAPPELAVAQLSKYGHVSIVHNMAILSLVGKEMRNLVGIASKMFSTLSNVGVSIEMISQGASEINISCVVEGDKAAVALNAIHSTCILNN